MAEAHSAVGFQFTVTPDGIDVDFNRNAFKAVVQSGGRSWRKRLVRFVNRFGSGVYPARLETIAGAVVAFIIVDKTTDLDLDRGAIKAIESVLPSVFNIGGKYFTASCVFAGGVFTILIYVVRYILKGCFSYHGWMFEGRGKKSITTRIWGILVTIFKGRNPLLYSYQGSLPKLPVPAIKDTLNRYLRSVRPLLTDEEYEDMALLAEEFQMESPTVFSDTLSPSPGGPRIMSLIDAIMVNSNFYAMDLALCRPTDRQTARAATLIQACFRWRSQLDKERVKPLMAGNMVPLCSYQYERTFNTTRIPGIDKDKIVKLEDSRHVAVYHKGRWFKVYCYYAGRLLTTSEIEHQLDLILKDDTPPARGEEDLACLTAGKRVPWAQARQTHFSYGVNAKSLKAIESSAFCVCLDEGTPKIDLQDKAALSSYAKDLLHGKTNDRWFDKTFTLVVFKNGIYGANVEHSWADAPIFGHLCEEMFYHEFARRRYKEDGTCDADRAHLPFKPEKLTWEIDEDCYEIIQKQKIQAQGIADDVDMHIHPFGKYHGAPGTFGKRLIKSCGVSPDAFVQLALQLANYRDQGKFSLTYEASMTRLYREGRTETVRSCTNETSAFVKAMEEGADKETLRGLARAAAKYHVSLYQAAMTGKGVDRHLFTLYVVSRYLGLESKFLDTALTQKWRLSTSQTPHSQANLIDFKKHPDMLSTGGGFGPVSDDGYGVSYIICDEDLIMFHISSKHSCAHTNSARFGANIEKAMLDVAAVFADK
ncbi:Oidioi.mRNA.OKI2018_I69.PAR.g11835.t1.cds [Oikopleura dioica]|uniref:Oidioi.mRNA.OKI2018_I69.PAR.g11835.t1.cds n=1 Tax=Oikopleura dioica TaxID=34765 RepID=A0ABN7RXL7_OIKDI|nr:Oidioi.mRNA.OKI2018_I69.PAR.g11835.t1.cds [Oikopleura dioica]